AAMLLPALSKAKARALRTQSINNLKQVGLAARQFSIDNDDRLPVSFEEMMNELNTDKVTYDPQSGQRYNYIGAGLSLNDISPDSVIAYSPMNNGQCEVVLADGSVQTMNAARFGELSNRGLIQYNSPEILARNRQSQAIMRGQLQPASSPVQTVAPTGGSGGGGALAISGVQQQAGEPVATVAPAKARGLRSIRIEIPREGNAFTFTKVLNVSEEPLSVQARMMSLQTFQTLMMIGQLLAFLAGLAVAGWQWRRSQPNTFILTCAVALVLVSVASLLIAWRALHDALIIGFPVIVVAAIAWAAWKYFSRRAARNSDHAEPTGQMPPAIAMIVLLLSLPATPAFADEPAASVAPIGNLQPAIGNFSITSALYTGTVNDRVAQLEAVLNINTTEPGQLVPLFGDDVAIQEFKVKSGDAKLVRDGNKVLVSIAKRSKVTLQMKLVVKIGGDVTRRHLAFNIPAALSSSVAFSLDQPDADVDFPTAISFKRATDKDRTNVDAIIGSGGRVELQWTPRVKRAAEVAATVFCQNATLVTVGGGVVNTRSVLDYQVTQGELRQIRVKLPTGQRLLRVEGEFIRTWEIKDDTDGQNLVVELLKGITPNYRLTVETEKALDSLPASVAVETPRALDVKRETGLIALRGTEEVTLFVESAGELQRVDVEEFARVTKMQSDGLTSVFRFLKPEFDLRARAETVQPQIEAVLRNYFLMKSGQVQLSAALDYTIKRAGVFSLKLTLPQGFRLDSVTGEKVKQWSERERDGVRVLEVELTERVSGKCAIIANLFKSDRDLPKSLTLSGVQPLGLAKLTGYVSVAVDDGIGVKTDSFDGLMEVPVATLPELRGHRDANTVLAFKQVSLPDDAAGWKLSVVTEDVEPWVRAKVVNSFTLTETLISGRALVRFDIANAPVKELRLKIPDSFKNVEISGANIRSRDQQGDVWRVELQSKVRGNYTLTVTWEQPRTAKNEAVTLTGVSAQGVERETGLLAIAAKAPLQVAESGATELTRVDVREFPDWAGKADDATVLAYRYVRPGYKLAVEARRHTEAQVLQALLDSATFTTVVADDGQVMTEMRLSVRNNGRQFLEVELPPKTTVWSAFVAGQPVRPSQRDGKLLLPLQEWGADEESVSVELTYVGGNAFPKVRGDVSFISPKFDVPLKNARWELYLPAEYHYDDFAGTMKREVAGTPSLLSFGLSEYSMMEKMSLASSKAEAAKEVRKAESNLASGNVRDAVGNYYRAKASRRVSEMEDESVDRLGKDLKKAQASNLIEAQQNFSYLNSASPSERPAQVDAGVRIDGLSYDSDAAGKQWEKLAQAQEIAASTVRPLHVNLPLRGLRYEFTQVLQTEVNKPMTVEFSATNTKTGHWLKRIGFGLVGFGVLWALMAFVTTRRHP
ncbi:MAG TPA: hypothetical protein PKA41_14765, partial [Verrucomicrobiota bacterium]|nr:hypothetical protein [Verrucomicrobiota bacterium]